MEDDGMKKLYGSFAAKLIVVILLCCLVLVFAAAVTGAIIVEKYGGYTGGYQRMRANCCSALGDELLSQIGNAYVDGALTEQSLLDSPYYEGEDAFWFVIMNAENQVLLSNYEGGKTLWSGRQEFLPYYGITIQNGSETLAQEDAAEEGTNEVTPTLAPDAGLPDPAEGETVWLLRDFRNNRVFTFTSQEEVDRWIRENTVIAKGYLPDPLPEGYYETWELRMVNLLYAWRFAFLWIAGLSFLAGVLVFIFLLCAAGHRKGTERIVPGFAEKIPFDLFTFGIAALIAVSFSPLSFGWDWPEMLPVLILALLAAGLLFLLWCMSLAVRVKLGTLLENCLLLRALRWLWQGARAIIRNLPILWKWALGLAVFAVLDLGRRHSALFSYNRETFWWFICWALIGGASLYAVLAFRRLRRGAKEIASGNMGYAVDEKNLLLDFKEHAHDLNHIRDGLNEAVEQRTKSERFRTELITNVSHDIKTPLTSIVNYVDLLQKEQPQTEKQREYLEVLSRQSGKLKKLIEDLIEASKASTGNLTVDLQPCDLGILLDQTAGEYEEKLGRAGLELVLQKPETPVTVLADGRHLWRVFDNLLNNIVKYAMPGTRVYLGLSEDAGKATVTFRNISREPLNISGEELTERFVRGDTSRNTEGSGLGLSIASSLTRLQKGDMQIKVDGDLFKVSLVFDTV
jgi:signal transduction histidine kinase